MPVLGAAAGFSAGFVLNKEGPAAGVAPNEVAPGVAPKMLGAGAACVLAAGEAADVVAAGGPKEKGACFGASFSP